MSDRNRFLAPSSVEAEINNYTVDNEVITTRNYGSIQSQPESSETEEIMDDKTTLKFFEKIGFSLGR